MEVGVADSFVLINSNLSEYGDTGQTKSLDLLQLEQGNDLRYQDARSGLDKAGLLFGHLIAVSISRYRRGLHPSIRE